jgi:hypothetical protein
MKSRDDKYGNLSEKMDSEVDKETGDELYRDFSESTAPENSFPSAAEPVSGTTGARQPLEESVSPFPNIATEYSPRPSNLPQSVSQRQILAENRDRWGNIGPADSPASAPSLAGTQVVENDNEV